MYIEHAQKLYATMKENRGQRFGFMHYWPILKKSPKFSESAAIVGKKKKKKAVPEEQLERLSAYLDVTAEPDESSDVEDCAVAAEKKTVGKKRAGPLTLVLIPK
mmetsp:Transcript_19415/g.48502  ORF Transcript_19415/g.48502 Transcript_19415/m.48502 type:complete len:104 (-) Transcript_19415:38-349(-)